jgi:hypothetical protein
MTDIERLELLEESVSAMSDDTITEWLDYFNLSQSGSLNIRVTRLISYAHQSDSIANEIVFD